MAATSVLSRVRAEIRGLPEEARKSSLAAGALVLASRLDDASNRDTAALHRELRNAMTELRALEEPKREGDRLDELLERRTARESRPAV